MITVDYIVESMTKDNNLNPCFKIDHIKSIPMKVKSPLNGRVTQLTTGSLITLRRLRSAYGQMIVDKYDQLGTPQEERHQPSEEGRRWGEYVGDTNLITHNGETYLQMVLDQIGTRQYLVDGQPASEEEVEHIEEWKRKTPEAEHVLPIHIMVMKTSSIVNVENSFHHLLPVDTKVI